MPAGSAYRGKGEAKGGLPGCTACKQGPQTLAFFPQLCYNLCSFILSRREGAAARSSWMRTNRGGPTGPQRGLPPLAARCKQPGRRPPPTTAERGGEPLPGVPVTAQREARAGLCCPAGAIRVEPWSGFCQTELNGGASSRTCFLRDGAPLFVFHVSGERTQRYEDHLQ